MPRATFGNRPDPGRARHGDREPEADSEAPRPRFLSTTCDSYANWDIDQPAETMRLVLDGDSET